MAGWSDPTGGGSSVGSGMGAGSNAGKSTASSKITNWNDPNFGYTIKKNAKGAVTDATYNNPYGLGVRVGRQAIGGVWEILGRTPDSSYGPTPGITDAKLPATITADQAMYLFENATAGQLAEIQKRMYLAGLYGKEAPKFGIVQSIDKNAFKDAILGLLSTGAPDGSIDMGKYLDGIATTGITSSGSGAGSGSVQPLVLKISDPKDIATIIQESAAKLYGSKLNDAQLQNLVAAYQERERAAQTAVYNATTSGSGGEVVNPLSSVGTQADVQMFADQQIREQFPEQVAATGFGGMVMASLKNIRNTGYIQ